MSQENVEVVRRAVEISAEAGRQGDPGAGFDKCVREGIVASDLDWRAGVRGGVGVAGIDDFAGRDGFIEFMRRWTEDFDDFRGRAQDRVDELGGTEAATEMINANTDWDRLSRDGKRDLVKVMVRRALVAPDRGDDRVTVEMHGDPIEGGDDASD
jgi:hypothetical protein